jgi:hypothetical protein
MCPPHSIPSRGRDANGAFASPLALPQATLEAHAPDVQQISALEARSRGTFGRVPRVRRSVQGRRLHRALACERMLNCLDLAPFLSN